MATKDIAVIGGGAAGLAAAYLLQRKHRVLLFEHEARLGGHAFTVVQDRTPLDVGFMILNDRNYPTFNRLLAELGGIQLQPSEMSFGYQSEDGATQYALNLRPNYWAGTPRGPEPKLLGEILRLFRLGTRDLEAGRLGGQTYGEYLAAQEFSADFVRTFAIPMGAALWSSAPADVLGAPAGFVLGFYRHHGMLSLDEGPNWQTIVGGSREYVSRIQQVLDVELEAAPMRVFRTASGVELRYASGKIQPFDEVVIATQADQALGLLGDPDPWESELLGAWRYQTSQAVLHSDERAMPSDRGAWACWNYVQERPHEQCNAPTLTYHLDRLQGHKGLKAPYFLSMNPVRQFHRVHRTITFRHPVYTPVAVASREPLQARNGSRHTWFAGNYLGNGFHEDAIAAGAAVAAALGCPL
jgi:predicted NAD/FAD-binding protein